MLKFKLQLHDKSSSTYLLSDSVQIFVQTNLLIMLSAH